jgi:putative colanic acid biosynthesis acetyltransferase WcaF
MALLEIADNCVISQGAHLCGGSHDHNADNFQLFAKSISLAENVWICADAFLGPGVEIAEGVVVGARSVVVRSITQKWSVHAGFPAKFVKSRRIIQRQ